MTNVIKKNKIKKVNNTKLKKNGGQDVDQDILDLIYNYSTNNLSSKRKLPNITNKWDLTKESITEIFDKYLKNNSNADYNIISQNEEIIEDKENIIIYTKHEITNNISESPNTRLTQEALRKHVQQQQQIAGNNEIFFNCDLVIFKKNNDYIPIIKTFVDNSYNNITQRNEYSNSMNNEQWVCIIDNEIYKIRTENREI